MVILFTVLIACCYLFSLSILVALAGVVVADGTKYPFLSCTKTRSGHPIAIHKQVTCIPPLVLPVKAEQVKVFVPNLHPELILAWKCRCWERTVCTNKGFFGSHGIVSDTICETSILTHHLEKLHVAVSHRKLCLLDLYTVGKFLPQGNFNYVFLTN